MLQLLCVLLLFQAFAFHSPSSIFVVICAPAWCNLRRAFLDLLPSQHTEHFLLHRASGKHPVFAATRESAILLNLFLFEC